MPKETIVIDLGGSILSPEMCKINFTLLRNFKILLKKEIENKRFIVVVGGGSLARKHQEIAKTLKITGNNELDWLGIRSTQLNAELFRSYLGELAHPELILSEKQRINWKKGVLVSGGWHPGNSTDYIAVKLAEVFQAKKILVATNIDCVYDSDPKTNPKAKKISQISWPEFAKLFRQEWKPGMTVPLDPKAIKLGKKIKIPLLFFNGNIFTNFKKAISGERFNGTVVR